MTNLETLLTELETANNRSIKTKHNSLIVSTNHILQLIEIIRVQNETLDKYTSNPEHWDKNKDEWFAIPAHECNAKVEALAKGEK